MAVRTSQAKLGGAVGETVTGLAELEQSLGIILRTPLNSVPGHPTFGSRLFEVVDQPVNVVGPFIAREIPRAVRDSDPRIEVLEARIASVTAAGQIVPRVTWRPAGTREVRTTEVPLVQIAPAVSHNPATDILSLWVRAPEAVTGSGSGLLWGGKASAGTSAALILQANDVYVTQPSVALDGLTSVRWSGAYPLLEAPSPPGIRALLGCGDGIGASYTCAYVVRPLAANSYNLVGGETDSLNGNLLGGDILTCQHALMSDAGTLKVGVFHQDAVGASSGGTVPVAWPGGVGAWGLMWVTYVNGGSVKIRVNKVDLVDQVVPVLRGPTASDRIIQMGRTNGGVYAPSFDLLEAMVFPGRALSPAEVAHREQGYFKGRYPSLGL